MSKRVMSTREAAEWLGIGQYYFRSLVRDGEIRVKRGSKKNKWLFTRVELERFAEERVCVDDGERAGADGTDE